MKLKTKLMISFCCIIILPTLLFIVFGITLVQYQVMAVRYRYGIEASVSDLMPGSVRLLDRMMQQIQNELNEKKRDELEFFWDDTALKQYCEEHAGDSIDFIVLRNGTLFFETDHIHEELKEEFRSEMQLMDEEMSVRYISDENMFIYPLLNMERENGSRQSLYAVVEADQWLPQLKVLVVQSIFAIIFVLILTASVFTIWVYRSVVRPINVLKDAAGKIKDGNLNFHINANEEDELGSLCVAFEEMRQRLKESAEAKVQFDEESKVLISNISHDLKTPITAIKGYVEGIMDGVADTPQKLDRYVKTIYNKAIDMDRLIDELTFYSKIDTNRIPYNFNKISVNNYFEECAQEVGMDLESRNIRFQYANYVDEPVMIIADPEQLQRVINNIIGNSVKYFDKPRCYINMRLRDVGDFIQVEIEDNAKGIAQKDLPYIFDRFYRTDSSRNSSKGGSGIGLSIVRKIIEDHGGKIWATSKEGTGTVMYFVLRKYQERVEATNG